MSGLEGISSGSSKGPGRPMTGYTRLFYRGMRAGWLAVPVVVGGLARASAEEHRRRKQRSMPSKVGSGCASWVLLGPFVASLFIYVIVPVFVFAGASAFAVVMTILFLPGAAFDAVYFAIRGKPASDDQGDLASKLGDIHDRDQQARPRIWWTDIRTSELGTVWTKIGDVRVAGALSICRRVDPELGHGDGQMPGLFFQGTSDSTAWIPFSEVRSMTVFWKLLNVTDNDGTTFAFSHDDDAALRSWLEPVLARFEGRNPTAALDGEDAGGSQDGGGSLTMAESEHATSDEVPDTPDSGTWWAGIPVATIQSVLADLGKVGAAYGVLRVTRRLGLSQGPGPGDSLGLFFENGGKRAWVPFGAVNSLRTFALHTGKLILTIVTGNGATFKFSHEGGALFRAWLDPVLQRYEAAIQAQQSQSESSQQATSPARSEKAPMLVADELKKLADLRDSGVLSQEEFLTQKSKLLA